MKRLKKTKSWFFEKINKIDNPLARLTKKKIRNEREVPTYTTEIQRLIKYDYEQLHANKLGNLEEKNTFLEISRIK